MQKGNTKFTACGPDEAEAGAIARLGVLTRTRRRQASAIRSAQLAFAAGDAARLAQVAGDLYRAAIVERVVLAEVAGHKDRAVELCAVHHQLGRLRRRVA